MSEELSTPQGPSPLDQVAAQAKYLNALLLVTRVQLSDAMAQNAALTHEVNELRSQIAGK